jgi:hypothetical protein
MTRYIGNLVFAVLAGLGCWFFGLNIVSSIVVVLVVLAAGITIRTVVRPVGAQDWPPPPPKNVDGERHEVAQLGWAIQSPRGIVDERIILRIQRIASGVLARRQLDLANPAHRVRIERLLGGPTYLLLTAENPPRVGVASLLAVIGRLEALERSDPAARN